MPSKRKPDPSQNIETLISFLCLAVGAVAAKGLDAWDKHAAPAAKISVSVALGVALVSAVVLLAFRKRRAAVAAGALGTLAAIVTLYAFGLEQRRAPDRDRNAELPQATLVVHPADASIVGIERLNPGEVGRRVLVDGTSSFEFMNAPKEPDAAPEVELTARREGGRLWLQRVSLHRCEQRQGTLHCRLPADLSWKAEDFLSLGRTDTNGSIISRRVAAVMPGDGCTPLAGKSLRAGAALFNAVQRSIAVELVDDASWKHQRKSGDPFISVAGSYNSWASKALIESCGRDCGPILTFSSAQSLRRELSDPGWVFRMTSSNRRRAEDLIPLLASEFDRLESAELQIVYNDDRFGTSGVHYAYDQAAELQRAMHDNTAIPRPYWVGYNERGFAATAPLGTAPPERAQLDAQDFDQLVAHLRARAPHAIVVFIDLDAEILQFGQAIRKAQWRVGSDLRWYVPGPRELFEGVWQGCHEHPNDLDSLEGVRVLGPDAGNTSVADLKFAQAWQNHPVFGHERVPARAARMYDALQVINNAVAALDALLPSAIGAVAVRHAGDAIGFVHVDVYRDRLRAEIHRTTFHGASGTIAFDEQGDVLSGSFVSELRDKQMQPIAVRKDRRPLRPAQSGGAGRDGSLRYARTSPALSAP